VQDGNELVRKLNEMKFNTTIKYHPLDIENQESITNFSKHLGVLYDGIDILVNNAGVMHKNEVSV
jgi:NADP-dependent 3-hydroxy acid dehydrogenase YdfG